MPNKPSDQEQPVPTTSGLLGSTSKAPVTAYLTKDDALERAIDEAGRDKVFALARASGWDGYMAVPKAYWWDFCRQAKAMQ